MEGKTYAMKFSFSTMQHKFIQLMILWLLSVWEQCNCYPATRAYIFAVWAGVRKVASTDNRSIFYRACAKFVTLFASKILSSGLSSNAASFAERKKLRQLWSATQGSRNGLNRSRQEKNRFFNLFVQISGRIWTVASLQRLLFAPQLTQRNCSLCSQGM